MVQVALGGNVLYSSSGGGQFANFAQNDMDGATKAYGAIGSSVAVNASSGGPRKPTATPISAKEWSRIDKFLSIAVRRLVSIDGLLKERLSNQRFKYNAQAAAIREANIESSGNSEASEHMPDATPSPNSGSSLLGMAVIAAALATQFDPIKEQMINLYEFSKSVGEKFIDAARAINNVLSYLNSLGGNTSDGQTQPLHAASPSNNQTQPPAPQQSDSQVSSQDTSPGWFARQAAPTLNPPASNVAPQMNVGSQVRDTSPGLIARQSSTTGSQQRSSAPATSPGWFARQQAPTLNQPSAGAPAQPPQQQQDASPGWFARQAAPALNPPVAQQQKQGANGQTSPVVPGGKLKDHVNSLFKLGGGNTGNADNLNNLDAKFESSVVAMLNEYKQKTGSIPTLTSGFRTAKEQREISSAYMKAAPGTSKHERGLALDFNSSDVNKMKSLGLLSKYGLHQRYGSKDPVHIEPTWAGGGTDPIYDSAGEDGGQDADKIENIMDKMSTAFKGLRGLSTADTEIVPFETTINKSTPNQIGKAAAEKYAETVASKNKPAEVPPPPSLPNLNAAQPNGTVQNPGSTSSDMPILYQYLQYFNAVSNPPPSIAATELV